VLKTLGKLFSGSGARPDFKLERNNMCWCGSGVKYKRCHMDRDLEKSRRKADACKTYS
jgi:hypothetical protein